MLLRLSVHDPIAVLNSESDEEGGILKMCSDILAAVSQAANIEMFDITALKNFVEKDGEI